MGTYKVNPDGKAPAGLSIGDVVVTGGGSYIVTGFKSDGSYQSKLIDKDTTTYNYKGKYDTAPGSADLNKNASWDELVSLFKQQASTAVNEASSPGGGYQGAALPAVDAMSFKDAMTVAKDVMQPQYDAAYQAAAKRAGQNLEKAGLYDTVYGQALAADAQKDVAADLNTAIVSLALQLTNASQEQAQKVLELAVKERQFGADYSKEQKETALKYLLSLIS